MGGVDLNTPFRGWWPGQMPVTMDPKLAGTLFTVGSSNRCHYSRVIAGSGTISKVGVFVGTSSGNVAVAVYNNNGSLGPSARPGTRVATSGSVACPTGTAYGQIALGASVYVEPGMWLAITADNTTATFYGILQAPVIGSGVGLDDTPAAGFLSFQDTAFPPPASASAYAGSTRNILLVGVA